MGHVHVRTGHVRFIRNKSSAVGTWTKLRVELYSRAFRTTLQTFTTLVHPVMLLMYAYFILLNNQVNDPMNIRTHTRVYTEHRMC